MCARPYDFLAIGTAIKLCMNGIYIIWNTPDHIGTIDEFKRMIAVDTSAEGRPIFVYWQENIEQPQLVFPAILVEKDDRTPPEAVVPDDMNPLFGGAGIITGAFRVGINVRNDRV
jgi:hypothetical protein